MNEDSDWFDRLPEKMRHKIGACVLAFLFLSGFSIMVATHSDDFWDAFGDLSGWVSALISALGFIFIYFQLQQQKHHFEQTSRISLYERRFEILRQIRTFTCDVNYSEEDLKRFELTVIQANYLFPDNEQLTTDLQILKAMAESYITYKNDYLRIIETTLAGKQTYEIEQIISQGESVINGLHRYLKMPENI